MKAYRKNALHKRIGDLSNRTWSLWKRRLGLVASGACTNCGKTPLFQHWLCFDHRDYGDVLNAKVVCYSCNAKLGPGYVGIIDPETLCESELYPFA